MRGPPSHHIGPGLGGQKQDWGQGVKEQRGGWRG